MNPAALPLYLYSFFLIMSVMAVFPVLPEIRSSLGVSYSQISFFVGTLGVVRLVLAYPSGFIVDHLDRKKVLVFSGALAAAGLALTGAANGMIQLVAGRAFVAAASILSNLTVLVVLADLAGSSQRGAMLSMNNVAHNAGGIVSPVVAGVLARWFNWRVSLLALAALVVFGTVLIGLALPSSPKRAERAVPVEIGSIGVTLGGTRRLPRNLVPLFCLSLFVFFYRSSFRHTLLPLFANDVLHLPVDTTGFYLGLVGVVSMLSLFCFGFVADRCGRKAVLLPSLALAASAGAVLLLPPGYGAFAGACVLTGLGGAMNSMPNVLISDQVDPQFLGRALGTNRIFADFGYFLGSISVGFLLDQLGFRAPIVVVVGLALGTLLLVATQVREPER
jgi:predicted MFS family arabinose efflux permease